MATHRRTGRLPNPATLERLAAGLDLPLNVVRGAAASAAGLVLETPATGDLEIEVLIASFARLTPADRRHVAALVRSMLAAAGPAPEPGSAARAHQRSSACSLADDLCNPMATG